MILMACVLFSVPGYSQTNPFPRDIGLTKQDMTMLRDAAKKLYTNESAAVGASESWNNAESGNSGTVTVIKLFKYKESPCKQIRHDITVKGQADVKHYKVKWCQVGGEWKRL